MLHIVMDCRGLAFFEVLEAIIFTQIFDTLRGMLQRSVLF